MKILVNCSGLKKGGGLQVGDSICRMLNRMLEHEFVAVLSDMMDETANAIAAYPNVHVERYDIHGNRTVILTGRDRTLDGFVNKYQIEGVFSVFGPIPWCPKVPHLCGFARPQLVLHNSPYFRQISASELVKHKIRNRVLRYFFNRGVDMFWTENPMISELIRPLFPKKPVVTVTNTYSQVFDNPELWKHHTLEPFDGIRLITVGASYDHKNVEIALPVARLLKELCAEKRFRFVFTIEGKDYPMIPEELKDSFELIGKVYIAEVPSLYGQCQLSFQPTLLECFTATYPESMRMGLPIITTDLDFARGLCGDAAVYYDAVSPEACAEAILKVANDEALQKRLVAAGKERLKIFDTATSRATKLIGHLVDLVNSKRK